MFITYNGEYLPLITLAERLNLEYATLHSRITLGWDIEKAINEPIREKKNGKEFNVYKLNDGTKEFIGTFNNQTKAAKEIGITYGHLHCLLNGKTKGKSKWIVEFVA